MRAPRTVVGTVARGSSRHPWLRRAIILVITAVFALLAFYPERYRAATTITPTDPTSFGLSGTLNQLGAVNTVFGSQAAIEVALKVAASVDVRSVVMKRLGLPKQLGRSEVETSRWLDRKMNIRSLRGGMIQMEVKLQDPVFARRLIEVYASVTRDRLAAIGRTQTGYKREILLKLVTEASDRLARARGDYDAFRLRTRYSDPYVAIASISARIPVLEQAIKAKDVQISAGRRFATDSNPMLQQLIAQKIALEGQLAQARGVDPGHQNTVGRVVQESTEAERLLRNLDLAEQLYQNYRRFLLGTSVEQLTSDASVRYLEPPYVDTEREINIPFAAGAILILLAGVLVEFYGFRPPVGGALSRA